MEVLVPNYVYTQLILNTTENSNDIGFYLQCERLREHGIYIRPFNEMDCREGTFSYPPLDLERGTVSELQSRVQPTHAHSSSLGHFQYASTRCLFEKKNV